MPYDPTINEFLEFDCMRLRAIRISFDQGHPVESCRGEHGSCLNGRCRQWFLAQHVLARFRCTNGPLGVQTVWQWIVNRIDIGVREQLLVGTINAWHTRVGPKARGFAQASACNRRHAYRFGRRNACDEGARDISGAENSHSKARRSQLLHWTLLLKGNQLSIRRDVLDREQHHENNRCNADSVHLGWNSSGYLRTGYPHAGRILDAWTAGYHHRCRHHRTFVFWRRESGSGDRWSSSHRFI